jgi:hypothetical protein
VTRSVGPFDDPDAIEQQASAYVHRAAWWTTGQQALEL